MNTGGDTSSVPVVAFRGWPDIDPPAGRGVEPGSIPLSTTTCAKSTFPEHNLGTPFGAYPAYYCT